MSTVVFTSSALRHKAFASIISSNKNFNVIAVFNESCFPLNDLIKKRIILKILIKRLIRLFINKSR